MIGAAMLAIALATGPGMGLSISPAAVSGPQLSHGQFTFTDSGKTAEHIRVQAVKLQRVNAKDGQWGWVPAGIAGFVKLSPATFDLQPGHKQVIKVNVNSTDGYAHNVGIMAIAQTPAKTGATISASVTAQIHRDRQAR